jgi:cell division topological specificity factor
VVSKHIQLDPDKVMVKLERGKTVSTLEVDIEVPNNFDKKAPGERRMAG